MRLAGLIAIVVVLLAPARLAGATGCAGADGLAAAGELDAAKKAYVAAIAKDNPPCAQAGLAKVKARQQALADAQSKNESGVRKLRHRLSVIAGYIGAFLLWVLALLLAAGVLAALATHWFWLLRQMRKVPWAGRPFRPSLTIVPFTDERASTMAASTTSVVRSSLSRLQREQLPRGHNDYRLDNRDGAESIDTTVGRLGDLFPQAKGVAAILHVVTQVARSSRYKLAGTVLVPADTMRGVTVTIDRARGNPWTTTLWRDRGIGDDAQKTYYLASAAAGWADFRLRQLEQMQLPPDTTESATSYGHFRAAYELERGGQKGAAAAAYMEALKHDRKNYAAILNLARLQAHLGSVGRARRYYQFGLSLLREGSEQTRPIWYQLQYGIAALEANWGSRDESLIQVAELLRVADATRTAKPKETELLEFLGYTVEPAAVVLSAGLRDGKRGEQRADADDLVAPLLDQEISYRAAYNLACFYARRPLHDEARPTAPAAPPETNEARALRYLRLALVTAPPDEQTSLADWAEDDPSFAEFPKDMLGRTVAPFQTAPGPGGRLGPPPSGG